ncbi:alpha/beta fold hydrolase [Altererythrobacter sp. GH1-8]|uniref:alpha/beta fold hydrolase n=1 Tax=Altererythrobacter sp. GH1-8 TaxID=3349333 RepID=UPI00374D7C6B
MSLRITIGKKAARIIAALAALSVLLLSPAQAGAHPQEPPEISWEELKAKYALPNSKFVEIDGVNVHYVDEGEGPAVVLLHASYNSLLTWNGTAEALKANHRVIRFDFPGAGLSGTETKPVPEGKYNMIERYHEILAGLVDKLELEQFALIGTSSGGSVAFRYASRHPDRLSRLVLINSAGLPRTAQTNPLRELPQFAQWENMKVRPLEFWQESLSRNYFQIDGAPEWQVEQAYDFRRRAGLADEVERSYGFATGDPRALLGGIRAPTLIMWGMSNPTVMHLEADVIEHWMTGAPTTIRKYEGLGHYPYIEAPERFLPDLAAFLSGEMDEELRRTARVSAECVCEQ